MAGAAVNPQRRDPYLARLDNGSRDPAGRGQGGRPTARYIPQCGIGMPCDCGPPPVTSASVTAVGGRVTWDGGRVKCGLPKVVRTAVGGAAAASAPDVAATAPPATLNPARATAAMTVRTDMDVSLSRRF